MVDDQIDTVGKAFLGLTLGCARCHDHKFDPVSQEDYYALAGIFYSTHILKDLGAKGAEYVMNRVPLVPKAQVEAREKQLRLIAETQAKLAAVEKAPQAADFEQETGRAYRGARPASAWPSPRASAGHGGAGRGNAGRTVSQDPGRADPHPRELRQAWDRSSRGDCHDSSRAIPNRPFAKEAAGGNWLAGSRRQQTRSPPG